MDKRASKSLSSTNDLAAWKRRQITGGADENAGDRMFRGTADQPPFGADGCGRRRNHVRRRRSAGAGEAEGRRDLLHADRGALGQPDPRGAAEGAGGARHRIQMGRERALGRLCARAARIRPRRLQDDHRRRLRRRGHHPPRRQGISRRRLRVRLGPGTGRAELLRLRQLDPRAGLSLRHDRRQAHQVEHHRHGRGDGHSRRWRASPTPSAPAPRR